MISLTHISNLPNEMASTIEANIVILCFASKLQKMKIVHLPTSNDIYEKFVIPHVITLNNQHLFFHNNL